MKLKLLFIYSLVLICSCTSETDLPPLLQDDVIVSFGDSLTYGIGTNPENSYPSQLQKMLLQKVINSGISGEDSSESLLRIHSVLEMYRPALVIICIGGNDFLRKRNREQVSSNIGKLVEIIKDSGANVLLIAVPEPSLFLSASPIYAQLAEKHKVLLIEESLSDYLSDNALKSDGIHLNSAGYKLLAEAVLQALIESGLVREL